MPITKPRALLLTLLAALSGSAGAAVSTSLSCPPALPTSAIKIDSVDGDWVPYVKSPMYLYAAAPIDGPPDNRGDLVPDKERRGKGTVTTTYTFQGSYPQGKWLQCAYGENSQMTLSRRMPDAIAACTITYGQGTKAGQRDIKIECR